MACRDTDEELKLQRTEAVDKSIPESRDDLIRSILSEYLKQDTGNRQLRLITIGDAGQGKSSLVNGIIGEQLAPEGGKLNATTTKVERYTSRDGTAMVWDTPGFGMAGEDQDRRYVKEMATECAGKVDLMLYCISMKYDRWPKHSDNVAIRLLTQEFGGPEIWKYCQFVLTFANKFRQGSSEEDEDPDKCFFQRVNEFEDNVKQALKYHADLPDKDIQKIRVVVVGDPRPRRKNKSWRLPNTADWFIDFWLAITRRIQQSALPTLLQRNRHRIDFDESLNPPSEEQPYYHSSDHTEVLDQSIDSGSSASSEEEQAMNGTPLNRNIPIRRILYEQINDEGSSFRAYCEEEVPKVNSFWSSVKALIQAISMYLLLKIVKKFD